LREKGEGISSAENGETYRIPKTISGLHCQMIPVFHVELTENHNKDYSVFSIIGLANRVGQKVKLKVSTLSCGGVN
jgi:hypothetical protein